MRPASEVERRRCNDLFAELCAIASPSHHEAAVARRVRSELEALGFAVQEDGAAGAVGGDCGNLVARLPGRDERWVLLCAHLDTVAHTAPIEPVLVDGGWESAGDTILGADNKAAVAVALTLAHRAAVEGVPIGVELVFTVAEEAALAGAKAFDVSALRARSGFVFDDATPIGGVVVASPTQYRLDAEFRGRAAHAGVRPEDGRSAILAASRAVAAMQHGRRDAESTTNVASIAGGGPGTNVVPERCVLTAETRSLTEATAEALAAELVDRCYDAANDPECDCDLDVDVSRQFGGYRHRAGADGVVAAEAALRACGYEPRRIVTGGGSDANVFTARGLATVNVANGTERNHEPAERVSQVALEGMIDVVFALLDELAATPQAP